MKFTTPCFVRVEDVEKRKALIIWCIAIGYYPVPVPDFLLKKTVICCDDQVGLDHNPIDFVGTDIEPVDCGTNIELFNALAAMNDENDFEQCFVVKKDIPDVCGDCIYKRGDLFFNDCQQHIKDRRYLRKATAEEIIKHFNKI